MSNIVFIDKIPQEALLSGVMVNNIAKMRIITRAEKSKLKIKAGSPDVEIFFMNKSRTFVTRNEAIEKCRDAHGNRLNMNKIRDGKVYTVCIPSNIPIKVFKVPNYNKLSFSVRMMTPKGAVVRPVKTGVSIVYFVMANGKVDKQHPLILSASVFKKSCLIKEPDRAACMQRQAYAIADILKNKDEAPKNSMEKQLESDRILSEAKDKGKNVTLKADTSAPFFAVGRIVRQGTYEQVIGYIVSNGKVNKALPLENVMTLCKQKKMRNMCIVQTSDGKEFVRGVGIRLETLPIAYK